MRNFRILFTIIAVLFLSGTMTAQSKNLVKRAEKKVTQLNEKLSAIDAMYALSEEQMKQAQEVYLTAFVDMKKVRKETSGSEEGGEKSKSIRKAMNKKIRKEVLTKDQRNAMNAANKKNKDK